MRFKPNFFAGILLVAVGSIYAAGGSKSDLMTDVPVVVQTTINAQIGDGSLEEVDQTNDGGQTTFDVTVTNKNGEERDFTVADDGTLVSVEVTQVETPAAVRQTIRAEVAGWELESIDKDLEDTELAYDVTATKDGKERNFTVAEDGALVSLRLELTNAPAAVQTTVNVELAGGNLKSVYENFDPAGNNFDVAGTSKDGRRKSFSLSADGVKLSEEVTLKELAPGARKTIEARMAAGKIIRIDKSLLEKRGGVKPYEVQGRRDGKPFNFSVGPRGRFLGMDD